MSAVQPTYRAVESARVPHHWDVVGPNGQPLDTLRTIAGAAYAVRLLNAAQARVNPHACIGCRVEVTR